MVNFFEFVINIVEMLIILTFLTKYFKSKNTGVKKILGFILFLVMLVFLITFFNSMYNYEGFLCILFIVLFFLYAVLFLKGNISKKLFIAGFITCVAYFIALLTTLLMSIVHGQSSNQLYYLSLERILWVVIGKVALVIACFILLKFRVAENTAIRDMPVIVLMPIAVNLSMVGIMHVFTKYSELSSELLLASISVMVANILTYYVYLKIDSNIKVTTELNAINQKYTNDKQHLSDIQELYAKMCGIRHDLILHFTVLSELMKNDNESANKYINFILDNQIGHILHIVKTDNETFNAIANVKVSLCDKCGIDLRIRIMNNSLNKLSDEEIGILFGNLFDNAIEASKNTEKKSIELDIQTQKKYLSIFMKNSIDKSVLNTNQELKTTKDNSIYHGYGTKNIKNIVKKHHGMINYFEEDGYFCCDILI